MKLNHSSSSRLPFFGYFCIIQKDGTEKIVVNSPNKVDWEFPIHGEFDPTHISPEEAINNAVSNFVDEAVFTSRDELQTSGISPFQIHRVQLADSQIPAFFFKARLEIEIGQNSKEFIWVNKANQFGEHRGNCLQNEFLNAIEENLIYEQVGFKMLECIDVLVFKLEENNVQFLMLRREDRSISISGWEYSKGPVLFHETHQEAAARELLDETGLSIENYRFIMEIGYQGVDVHWRKKNYDTMHLLGMTYLLTGNEDDIVPYKKEGLRRSTWMTWEKAKESVWMRDYGPVFFDRWKENEDYILGQVNEIRAKNYRKTD